MENKLPSIDEIWDYSNPTETESKFRALLPKAEQLNPAFAVEIATQIARTLGLQRKFEEALQVLNSVKNKLSEQLPLPTIRYHLEKGRVYNSNKKTDLAIPEFKQALELAIQHKEDYFAVDAAHMLGIADTPDKKLDWSLEALALAEKSKNPKAVSWKGSLYNNIGWTYHNQREFVTALDYFEKAHHYWKEKQNPTRTFIATWTIARTYRSLNQTEKAIPLLERLEEEMKKGPKQDGYVYEELAECFLVKGDKEKTKYYFGLAYQLLSKDIWLKANEQDRLDRLHRLSMN